MRKLLASLWLALAFLAGPASAVEILNWDADAFDLPDYEVKPTGGGGGATTIDTSVKYSGTGSMKVISNGSQRDQGYQETNGDAYTISLNTSYYQRVIMKFQTGWSWAGQEKLKANRWTTVLTGYLGKDGIWPGEHNSGFTSDQGAGSGGEGPYNLAYDFDPDTNPVVADWFELIVLMRTQSTTNATDGRMEFWINGVSQGALTGVRWWSGTISPMVEQWSGFMMKTYPQDATGTYWIDDVNVSTTFNSIWDPVVAPTYFPIRTSYGDFGDAANDELYLLTANGR